MLAFPLSTLPSLPWAGQAMTAPLTAVTSYLAAAFPGEDPHQRSLPLLYAATTWLLLWLALALLVAVHYSHGRNSASLPVKALRAATLTSITVLVVPVANALAQVFTCAPGSTWGTTGLACYQDVGHVVLVLACGGALVAFAAVTMAGALGQLCKLVAGP